MAKSADQIIMRRRRGLVAALSGDVLQPAEGVEILHQVPADNRHLKPKFAVGHLQLGFGCDTGGGAEND